MRNALPSPISLASPGAGVPAGAGGGAIRVCVKKNCRRNGGRELWLLLEEALAARGLSKAIRLEAVKCLDRCQAAPNAECRGRAFQSCLPADVEKIVARAAAGLEPPTVAS
ncbi:MAG: (2Fe-2S) ferredoxin domain-containing protein [Verrucomicrobia bacterium]|nr:(2Fe-2S) ferredoxin domain-containing protein [Verrucomicrobiota bacterium]